VLQHTLAPVRRNDAQTHILRILDVIRMRVIHGARMESGDLIVVEIGGNESLCREGVRNLANMTLRQLQLVEAIGVGLIIVADGGHDQRLAAQHLQRVRDVAGATAELAAHVRHQKCDVENMKLIGKDVVPETVVEHHDSVIGNGAANQRAHEISDGIYVAELYHRVCTVIMAITGLQGGIRPCKTAFLKHNISGMNKPAQ
jgi:hypothetical protein